MKFMGKLMVVDINPDTVMVHPSRKDELWSVRLSLSEEDHVALKRAAADANTSLAAYARKVVTEAVKAYRPARKKESTK